MERDSIVYAQIGKEGPKGYRSGDGLPLDLGKGGGSKLYLHTLILRDPDPGLEYPIEYCLRLISTKAQPFESYSEVVNAAFIGGRVITQNNYGTYNGYIPVAIYYGPISDDEPVVNEFVITGLSAIDASADPMVVIPDTWNTWFQNDAVTEWQG